MEIFILTLSFFSLYYSILLLKIISDEYRTKINRSTWWQFTFFEYLNDLLIQISIPVQWEHKRNYVTQRVNPYVLNEIPRPFSHVSLVSSEAQRNILWNCYNEYFPSVNKWDSSFLFQLVEFLCKFTLMLNWIDSAINISVLKFRCGRCISLFWLVSLLSYWYKLNLKFVIIQI